MKEENLPSESLCLQKKPDRNIIVIRTGEGTHQKKRFVRSKAEVLPYGF